jgi:hypothetical protein
MKRLVTILALVAILTSVFGLPVAAGKKRRPKIDATVDVLIQATGSTNGLVREIKSLGGTINFQYKNVPVVAATIPVEAFRSLVKFSGVITIEKDGMVYPVEEFAGGKNDAHPMSYEVKDVAGVEVKAMDPAAFDSSALPEGYANFLYTGAYSIWGDTDAGAGTIVAVVDTGTVPNFCIGHAVIGAPGYPDGYNSTGDGVPATSPSNHWHGTHVGGVIASSCALDFTDDPTNPIYLAQAPHLEWGIDFVPILGQAPSAELYPVKVFPESGAGSPTSVILDGLDHVLTLKNEGLLDIDVVNMSMGGPTLWDGRDAFDRFTEELQAADMLVVVAAGNNGPIPNSVGSPSTSFGAVCVGALDYAPSSRTFYEYLGLAYWPGAPGMGMVMRPTDELRVVNFSGKGPMSDGRFGPEVVALGHWNFHEGPNGELRWAGGTSFSAPTVAGAAALLNAYMEDEMSMETDPVILENVLLNGADPTVVAPPWQGINDQGYGTLDVPASLDLLASGDWALKPAQKDGRLTANVLGKPVRGRTQAWESDTITLNPSESFDAVFEIGRHTSQVTIRVFDIVIPDNWDYAYWANALEVHLQSAKRTDVDHPVEVYWYPWYGDSVDIVIEDGPWTFGGTPWDDMPMENGLMKLSLIGDYSNEAPVSFKVGITRENERPRLTDRIFSAEIETDDLFAIPVDIPEGTEMATFDLTWHRGWNKFPTSDIDLMIFNPDGAPVSYDGATMNAPERAILYTPVAGTWWLLIVGYEVNKPDNLDVFMTLK